MIQQQPPLLLYFLLLSYVFIWIGLFYSLLPPLLGYLLEEKLLDLREFNNPESITNLTILSKTSVKFTLSFAEVWAYP